MRKNYGQIGLGVLMVVSGTIGVSISVATQGISMTKMYTEDSNIFNLLTSILYVCLLLGWIPQNTKNRKIVHLLRYISTACLALTIVVVLLVLAPMMGGLQGYKMMFLEGSMLYNHFFSPILAIVSFIFF
ncbi:hypothetical protein [Enterococcus camelliae]|uniref:Uncharacterized protein n=1 Tax=Enterococcus camelliae TaxID=453959 RepID=A0ABW5THZ5_9ENTE